MPDSSPAHAGSAHVESLDPPLFQSPSLRLAGACLMILVIAWSMTFFAVFQYFPAHEIAEATRGPLSPKRSLVDLLEVAPWALLLAVVLWGAVARGIRGGGTGWSEALASSAARLSPLALIALALWFDDPAGRQFVAAAVVGLAAWRVWPAVAPIARSLAMNLGPRRADRSGLAALVLSAAAAAFFFLGALARHDAHWSSLIDLGLFYELYDNAGQGALFSPTLGHTFLGEHFSPILYALWPVMKLFPSPVTLLAIQSISIALGGWVLFVLARDRLRHGTLAVVIMLGWLLSPYVQAAAFYDFHMDMLEPPLVFGLLVALHRRKAGIVWICAILLWLTKEDTFIYTSVFGAYAALFLGQRRLGLALLGVGLAQGLIVLTQVVPALRPPHDPRFFSTTGAAEGYAFAERYGHLGRSLGQVIGSAATNPYYVADYITSGPRLSGLLGLLLSFGGVAIFGRWRLLLLIPVLEMLLASPNQVSALLFYYGAVAFMFAPIVAIEGARALFVAAPRWLGVVSASRLAFALGVITACVAGWHPSSVLSATNTYKPTVVTAHHERAHAMMARIPPDVVVSATGYLAVHLMPGRSVSMFPYELDRAEWVLVDLQRPPWPRSLGQVHQEVLRLSSRGFRLVDAGEGLLLWRKGGEEGAQGAAARALANDHLQFTRIEAELSEQTAFMDGVVSDDMASNGAYRHVGIADRRGPGHLLYGPYIPIWPGDYTAVFRVRWQPDGLLAHADDRAAVSIDVAAKRGTLVRARRDYDVATATRELGPAWHEVRFDFTVAPGDGEYELRVFYHDVGALDLDAVWIEPRGGR